MRIRCYFNSIGDTLGLTAVAEIYYKKFKEPLEVITPLPELFLNNPFVACPSVFNSSSEDYVIEPCKKYDCNIVRNFANQLKLDFNNEKPKIYLSNEEIFNAKNLLKNYSTKKYKIAVCLNAAVDSRSLKYDVISPLLLKIKNELNCDLFLVGKVGVPLNDKFNLFTNQIYGIKLRDCFGVISQCDAYIGVDTGLSHAAAALDVPQVVFFRNAGCHFNAYSDTYYYNSDISCSGNCLLEGCHWCDKQNRCMDNFNLEKYFLITSELLK